LLLRTRLRSGCIRLLLPHHVSFPSIFSCSKVTIAVSRFTCVPSKTLL
jgi:hypothetical protein